MRRTFAVFCLLALTVSLAAQSPAGSQAKAKPSAPKAQLAAPQVPPPPLPHRNQRNRKAWVHEVFSRPDS